MLFFLCCPYRSKYIPKYKVLCRIASPLSLELFVLFMSLHILKVNFSLLLTFIIIFKTSFLLVVCTYRCFHLCFVFYVETLLLIHFQGAAMLQHRSVLFAPLNFRTRLFYLALSFAVLVCASLCFLIFARFVQRLISGTTRSSFAFCRVLALSLSFHFGI